MKLGILNEALVVGHVSLLDAKMRHLPLIKKNRIVDKQLSVALLDIEAGMIFEHVVKKYGDHNLGCDWLPFKLKFFKMLGMMLMMVPL